MNAPHIDVLLPIKSPAPWLNRTLMSLSDQTLSGWRLVAAIHGEDSLAKVQVLDLVPNALVVNAPDSGNLASTLNVGLAATSAPLIARIDQDDIAMPGRFQTQVDYLQGHPDVLAVGTGAILIDEAEKIIGYRKQRESSEDILKILRWKSGLIHPSVMFRRKAVMKIGGYSELATNVEDYDLWLRLALHGSLGGINRPLIKYRIHPQQTSSYRSIPPHAITQLYSSRIAFAANSNESTALARIRHSAWSSRQWLRRIMRQGRT